MISSPALDHSPISLVDWLELNSIFSIDGRAFVDQILDAFDLEADFENPDVAASDAVEEDLRFKIAAEIEERMHNLGSAYPFSMTRSGEILNFAGAESQGQLAYVISLLAENSWRGGLLLSPSKFDGAELRKLRDAFEVIAALAAAGYTGGHAYLIGANRSGAVALLRRIQHICDQVGEGRARPIPEQDAPLSVNDGGVDIIAVQLEQDGPPHSCFYFCQSATGANFRSKPVINEIPRFLDNWFEVQPINRAGLVVIPAMLERDDLRQESMHLGHILHRARAPRYAEIGAGLVELGRAAVDCWDRRQEIVDLVADYSARTGAQVFRVVE